MFFSQSLNEDEARQLSVPLKTAYLANADDLRALDHALRETFSWSLSDLRPQQPCTRLEAGQQRYMVKMEDLPLGIRQSSYGRSHRSCVRRVDGTTFLEAPQVPHRRVLHEWLDMGSVGWNGRYPLFHKWQCRGSMGFDPSHRRWDNVLNVYTSSGLNLLRLEMLVLQTFTSGPWHSDGNFRKLEHAAVEWNKSSTCDDGLFRFFYARICRDLHNGRYSAEFEAYAHRKSLWDSLPNLVSKCVYGMHTKNNRWFQFVRRHSEFKQYWSLTLAVCCYCALHKGVWRGIDDSPLLKHTLPGRLLPDAELHAVASVSGISGPRSVAWSNEEMKKLRSSCKTGLELATTILAMEETRALATGTTAIALSLDGEHARTITEMKTRSGAFNWRLEMAIGGRFGPALRGMSVLWDAQILVDVGLLSFHGANKCEFSDESASKIADCLFVFARDLLAAEVNFARQYSGDFPNFFVALLDKDDDRRAESFRYVSDVWLTLTNMEQKCATDPWLDSYMRDLMFPLNIWCREVFVGIHECGGTALPGDIAQEVLGYARGFGGTKINEDMFNILRRRCKLSPNDQLGPAGVWHCSLTFELITANDMRPVKSTADDAIQANATSKGTAPKTLFESTSCGTFSLGEETLAELKAGALVWPHPSPQRFLLRPCALDALMRCRDDVGKLKRAYLSKLVYPGDVIVERLERVTDNRALAIDVNEYGIVTWPVHLRKRFDYYVVSLDLVDSRRKPWSQLIVADVRGWYTLPVIAFPPSVAAKELKIDDESPSEFRGIALVLDTRAGPVPILQSAAQQGFSQLTVVEMGKMVRDLEVPYEPPKPSSERDLAALLIRWVFPKIGEETLKEYLAKRGARRPTHDHILDDSNATAVEGMLRPDDADAAKKTVVKEKAKPTPIAPRTLAALALNEKPEEVASSSSSSGSGGIVPAPAPLAIGKKKIDVKVYDGIAARPYMPAVKGAWIGIHTGTAWQVRYPPKLDFPRSHTITWNDDVPGHGHYDSMVKCLKWVWAEHYKVTAEACPWEL